MSACLKLPYQFSVKGHDAVEHAGLEVRRPVGSESDIGYGWPLLLQDDAEDVHVVFASRRQAGDHLPELLVFALHLSVLGPVPHPHEVFGADACGIEAHERSVRNCVSLLL